MSQPAPDAPPLSATKGAPATPPLPRNVKLLSWASCLNDVASEMIFPLLPNFLLTVLGGDRRMLGLVEGVADSTASLLKLWAGAWSDAVGSRRGFVLFGYLLAAFVRPLTGVISGPWQLLAIRTADRFGKGIRTAPRDAMLADSSAPQQRGRVFGFHRAMDHLGAALGPVLATLFLWRWPGQLRTLFVLSVVPGLAVFGLLVWGLREPPRQTAAGKPFVFSLRGFGVPFRYFLLTVVVFTLGNSSDAFLLLRASEAGLSNTWLPLLWFGFHLAKSAGNFWLGRRVDRWGTRGPMLVGWGIYAISYFGFGLADSLWQIFACFLLYAVHYALVEPAEKAYVAQLVGVEQRGLAYGWFNFAIGIAAFPASFVFGWLYETWGAAVAFDWGASLALLAAVMLSQVRKPQLAAA